MVMSLSPSIIWLLVGIVLCLTELILPTAFIAVVLGISALLVAAIATVLPLGVQIAVWAGLSAILLGMSRRLIRQNAALKLDATEAETLTEILPGQSGRVLYEGNSWLARCDDHTTAIAPSQKVYVIARRGTTLIVVPETVFHA